MEAEKLKRLKEIAANIRLDILEEVFSASSGHPGGSLSIADILAYLYFEEMHVDPANPEAKDRDRFVLSKGHTAPALYAALAERGYIPREDLKTFRHADSYLQGHPDMKHTPGVDMTTGSLGIGISAACGMALSAKLSGMLSVFILFWETANPKRGRCGRPLCLPLIISWTTSAQYWILTVFR